MQKNTVRTTYSFWLLFCTLLTSIVCYLAFKANKTQDDIKMLKELSYSKSVIEESINRYFTVVLALEAFVHAHSSQYEKEQDKAVFEEQFRRFTQSLENENPSIISLQLAPKGIVTLVSQKDKNSKAIGHDLFKDDTRRDQVIRTVINKSTVVAGPLTLIQGGNAVIGRKAIFTNRGTFSAQAVFEEGRAAQGDSWPYEIPDDFWGFATMLVDTDRLFDEFKLSQLPPTYQFALRGKHGLGENGDIFWGNPRVFDSPDNTEKIKLPAGEWVMAIKNLNSETQFSLYWIIITGFIIGGLGFIVIYSRSKKLEAEAEAKSHSRFLATMSHEIRTPMNGIIGVAEVLKNSELNIAQKNQLDIILSNSKLLLRLVNDVLDFSKIDSGNMLLEQRPYNPQQTLLNSINVIEPQAKDKNIPINLNISSQFPESILGDEIRLQQILVNLLSNALKFTEHGQINVMANLSIKNSTSYIVIEIQDSGIGMSEKELKRIFTPFTQADQSVTRKFGGTGLGLVICDKLVSLMSGQISVKSKQGVGSTFTLELPASLVSDDDDHHKMNDLDSTVNKSGKTQKTPQSLSILIVDDQQMNLVVASMILQDLGHQCCQALSAREALSLIEANHFDIIYMDRHMPEMDGLEATRLIRKTSNSSTEPWIIALTASAREDEKNEYLEAGANDFMSKPVDFDHFSQTIANYLKHKKQSS